jgi:hypothetical protein
LSYILCIFSWGGWGRGIARFWKTLATFSLWYLFGIDFERRQLVTTWCTMSQVPFNSCSEPTTSQEKGHVIITSLFTSTSVQIYLNLHPHPSNSLIKPCDKSWPIAGGRFLTWRNTTYLLQAFLTWRDFDLGGQFLIWRNTTDLLQAVEFWHGDILTSNLR